MGIYQNMICLQLQEIHVKNLQSITRGGVLNKLRVNSRDNTGAVYQLGAHLGLMVKFRL